MKALWCGAGLHEKRFRLGFYNNSSLSSLRVCLKRNLIHVFNQNIDGHVIDEVRIEFYLEVPGVNTDGCNGSPD